MESLTSHYQQLLGLPSTWNVDNVDLSLPHKRVTIKLKYVGQDVTCPECESSCSIYDHAPEQRWRHLDTKIQLIKASARGFHSFESYRTRILFYCGKLDMAI